MWTCKDCAYADTCRSPHGERGLKYRLFALNLNGFGRSPHGERGLKCFRCGHIRAVTSRSPHGERGLK